MRFAVVVCVVVFATTLWAQNELKEAWDALRQGRWDDALKAAKEVLKNNPHDAEAKAISDFAAAPYKHLRLIRVLKCERAVFDLRFSHNGRFLYAGGGHGRIWRWETDDWSGAPNFRNKTYMRSFVRRIDVAPNGRFLAFTYGVISPKTGKKVAKFEVGIIFCVRFVFSGVAVSGSSQIWLFDDDGWRLRWSKSLQNMVMVEMTSSPDGKKIALVGFKRLVVLDAGTGREVAGTTIKTHGHKYGLTWSRLGLLASSDANGDVEIFDGEGTFKFKSVKVLHLHNGCVFGLTFSPDGRFLASAGLYDRKVKVTDALTGKVVWEEKFHLRARAAVFGPDGRILAVGLAHFRDDRPGEVRIYRIEHDLLRKADQMVKKKEKANKSSASEEEKTVPHPAAPHR